MDIRVYRPEDGVQALHAFVKEAMAGSYGRAYSPEAMVMFDQYHDLDSVDKDVSAGNVLGLWIGDALAGTATVANGELGRLFVDASRRGQGLGLALTQAALQCCAQLGWPKVTAWSVPWARRFYERFGFVSVNADMLDFHNTREVPVPYFEMELRPQLSATRIVPVQAEDLEELLAAQRQAFAIEAERYGDWDIPPLRETAAQTLQELARGDVLLKAVREGRIVGGIRGKMAGETGCIGRLFVLPEARRGGIARALMAAVEEALADATRYELFTGERSVENLALYERQGYALTGRTAPATPQYNMVWLDKPSPWKQIKQCIGRYGDGV